MKFRIVKVIGRIRIVERQRCAANTGVEVAGRKRVAPFCWIRMARF